MKYKIAIVVTCPDLPSMEDIPEKMELIIEADDKIAAVKFALKSSADLWEGIREKFNKEESDRRMNEVGK